MRPGRIVEESCEAAVFRLEAGRVEFAAQTFEPEKDEVRIQNVRLTIVSNRSNVAGEPGIPDLVATHTQLAREAEHRRDRVQPGPGTRLEPGQYVHQVDMAPVKARQVVVVPKLRIRVAGFPVARSRNTVDERPVVQHRQVEPAPVPRDEIGREPFDAIEKPLHDFGLRRGLVAERPDFQRIGAAQHAGYRDDAMKVQRQKVGAGLLLALKEHRASDVSVTESSRKIE